MGKDNCNDHSGCTEAINTLKRSDKEQWTAINGLKNRLPAWGTLVISLLTFLLGASLTYAGMVSKAL